MPINFFPIFSKLTKILQASPIDYYYFSKAFIRGLTCAIFYRLFRNNVIIKLPFFVYYKMKICGPGSVFIDKWCSVLPNTFDGLTITTYSTDAQINIGKNCSLGGVTIRCHNKIVIDDNALFANCLIQDALFSMINSTNSNVFIGKGVWLASQTIVLNCSNIGDESVLGIGSMCFNRNIPKGHLAVGNPVFNSVDIRRIAKMVGSL